MANVEHEALAYGEGHVIHFAEYANSTLREAATGLAAGDDHKVALQTDDHSYWVLTDYTGPTWVPLGTPGDDTVTGAKIVDDAIDSEHYTDGSIDKAHLSADCIDSTKIADTSVDTEHLYPSAVETAKIKDANVTRAKLEADIIDSTKIADDALDSEHLRAGLIDLAHMSANSVDSDQYVDGSIDAAHMEGAIPETGGNSLKVKVIDIGDWNMDSTGNLDVAHGLTWTNIRTVEVMIRDDIPAQIRSLQDGAVGNPLPGSFYVNSTNIKLFREVDGIFDSTSYNATSYNRGWITIWYVV